MSSTKSISAPLTSSSETASIDELHAVALEDVVVVLAVGVEAEAVLEAGAAAAGDGQPQEDRRRALLLPLQLGHPPRRAFGQVDTALGCNAAAIGHG